MSLLRRAWLIQCTYERWRGDTMNWEMVRGPWLVYAWTYGEACEKLLIAAPGQQRQLAHDFVNLTVDQPGEA